MGRETCGLAAEIWIDCRDITGCGSLLFFGLIVSHSSLDRYHQKIRGLAV